MTTSRNHNWHRTHTASRLSAHTFPKQLTGDEGVGCGVGALVARGVGAFVNPLGHVTLFWFGIDFGCLHFVVCLFVVGLLTAKIDNLRRTSYA
jgi:hypothetical protein